jgi:hypothetical protein
MFTVASAEAAFARLEVCRCDLLPRSESAAIIDA